MSDDGQRTDRTRPTPGPQPSQTSDGRSGLSRREILRSPETITLIVLLVGSVLAIVFMQYLVAPPKLLMGRSLAAIPPSLFPKIVLALMAVFCAIALWMIRKGVVAEQSQRLARSEWIRATALFAIMFLYALTMRPIGFLISTAIAMTLLSLLMGARNVFQIAAVALISPVLLYLAATQLLAVSLPELDVIATVYSRMLSLGAGAGAAAGAE